jgi:membrane protease YdiL (CAAX protease family)
MPEPVKHDSSVREIALFLCVTFATSWVVWFFGIRAKVREDFLVFGVAGPTLAAAWMRMRRSKELAHRRPFPVGLFLLLVPAGWAVLVMAAARVPFQSLSWDPWLLLPALAPALSISFLVADGELRWEPLRWPLIAILAMPAILMLPAGLAYFAHLPVVRPRPSEGALTTIGAAAIVFTKQFLFAGLLEEPGWRGWLLPRMQKRFSPLVASLLVWFPWALWHAPLDFSGGVGRSWMQYIQVRVVFFIAITVLLTWFYNRSGGSIVVVSLFHAGFNTFPFVVPYSPPFLALVFVWAIWVVVADRMWWIDTSEMVRYGQAGSR